MDPFNSSNSIGGKDRAWFNKFNNEGDRNWTYKSDGKITYRYDYEKFNGEKIIYKYALRWSECHLTEGFFCKTPHFGVVLLVQAELAVPISSDDI